MSGGHGRLAPFGATHDHNRRRKARVMASGLFWGDCGHAMFARDAGEPDGPPFGSVSPFLGVIPLALSSSVNRP
jgi:hypothetical protein